MKMPMNKLNKSTKSLNSACTVKKEAKANGRRSLCGVLLATLVAALLLSGVTLAINASADASALSSYTIRSNVKTSPMYLAIGLRYGVDAPFSCSMLSPYGFVVGETEITRTDRNFKPLFKLNSATVHAVCDTNLKIGYNSCSQATEDNADIGGYHVEIANAADIWADFASYSDLFEAMYEQCFPAYINGEKCIRIGAFPTYTAAGEAAATISSIMTNRTVRIASPSATGVSVLDDTMESILFEYEGGDHFYLGFSAYQQPGRDHAYIQDVATSTLYDGLFCFRHFIGSECNGLLHINMVELNTYVEGVLPNEIYTSWDIETQKAFAITVRSYSVKCVGKHYSSYGFDMCSLSHCENYRGRKLITSRVTQAVNETRDQILTFGSTIVEGLYSSSIGGWSVDPKYVWGGTTDSYLRTQATPWEKYSEYASGLWFNEVTAAQLKTACREYGETQINSNIARVETTLTGDSSPYVYSIKLTDSNGNTASATRCSGVRSLLSGYVWSANIKIGRGSVDYTYEDVISTRIINLMGSSAGSVSVKTKNGVIVSDAAGFNFLTDLGTAIKDGSSTLHIYTGNGIAQIIGGDIDIPMSTEPDANGNYTVVSNYGTFLIVNQLKQVKKTHYASSSSAFAIVGKGMGHGVGMSQFGASDLGEAGATASQILLAYFPGTTVSNYFDFLKGN